MAISQKLKRRNKIRQSIRTKITGTSERPRLSVYRSNSNIYAQIIDDITGNTLLSFSSAKLDNPTGSKVEVSKEVGKQLAELAKGKGITKIVFDRGGYLYHGRVKALAEGAREAGLNF